MDISGADGCVGLGFLWMFKLGLRWGDGNTVRGQVAGKDECGGCAEVQRAMQQAES